MSGSTVSPPSNHATFEARIRRRRLPIGAEYGDDRRTHVRIWAPAANRVAVVIEETATQLEREGDGYFNGLIDAKPGTLYQFRIDDRQQLYPDPASRFQPDGPHGPSEIVDPAAF